MKQKCYRYKIFYPSGNDTAIVYGTDFSPAEQKSINDAIMKNHPNVEQVGFVSVNSDTPTFCMAGGGFCGNGLRAAVWHFLDRNPSTLNISVPGVSNCIPGGIFDNGNVWIEVPEPEKTTFTQLGNGLSLVEMTGVSHIIMSPMASSSFLLLDEEERCSVAKNILEQANLIERVSCGVIFSKKTENGYKIYPCVHDLGMDTMKQETACGTGSVAFAMALSLDQLRSVSLAIEQISGKVITASVELLGGKIHRAIISGSVRSEDVIHHGFIRI